MDYFKLKQIINKNDPFGLLRMGAPENEYEPEVNSILKRLKKQQSEDEVKNIVLEEFTRWFGEETLKGRQHLLEQIAKDIIKKD